MNINLKFLFCFCVCFLSMSPVFSAVGMPGTGMLFILVLLTVCSNQLLLSRAHLSAYLLILLLVASSAVSAVFNDTALPLVFAFYFAFTALAVLQINDSEAYAMVHVASIIFMAFIFMAAIGVVYHLLGGSSFFTLANPDGRDNNFYLSTFSNAETFTIRPSAIYDEPGAFSFFICVLVILRSRLGFNLVGSAVLLLGGLLTQSISHVMFTLLWFLWALQRPDTSSSSIRHTSFHRLIFMLVFVLAGIAIYQSGFLDWALERAIVYYQEPLTNPRQRSLDEISLALAAQPNGVWFGFDSSCVQRTPDCTGLGENPLTPLIYGGLLVSWPYYLFLLLAFAAPFVSRDGLLLIGAVLLLLQRPYLLEFPYSALFALGYVVWFSPSVMKRNIALSESCHIFVGQGEQRPVKL